MRSEILAAYAASCRPYSLPGPWERLAADPGTRRASEDPAAATAALVARFSEEDLLRSGLLRRTDDGGWEFSRATADARQPLIFWSAAESPERLCDLQTAAGCACSPFPALLECLRDAGTVQGLHRTERRLLVTADLEDAAILRACGLPAVYLGALSVFGAEYETTLGRVFGMRRRLSERAQELQDEQDYQAAVEALGETPPPFVEEADVEAARSWEPGFDPDVGRKGDDGDDGDSPQSLAARRAEAAQRPGRQTGEPAQGSTVGAAPDVGPQAEDAAAEEGEGEEAEEEMEKKFPEMTAADEREDEQLRRSRRRWSHDNRVREWEAEVRRWCRRRRQEEVRLRDPLGNELIAGLAAQELASDEGEEDFGPDFMECEGPVELTLVGWSVARLNEFMPPATSAAWQRLHELEDLRGWDLRSTRIWRPSERDLRVLRQAAAEGAEAWVREALLESLFSASQSFPDASRAEPARPRTSTEISRALDDALATSTTDAASRSRCREALQEYRSLLHREYITPLWEAVESAPNRLEGARRTVPATLAPIFVDKLLAVREQVSAPQRPDAKENERSVDLKGLLALVEKIQEFFPEESACNGTPRRRANR